jgi:hypothetical protein
MGTFLCAVCLRYSEADVMPLVMNAAAACRHLMTCDVREGLQFIISAPALQAKAIIPISTFSANSSILVDLATVSRRLRVITIAIGYFPLGRTVSRIEIPRNQKKRDAAEKEGVTYGIGIDKTY